MRCYCPRGCGGNIPSLLAYKDCHYVVYGCMWLSATHNTEHANPKLFTLCWRSFPGCGSAHVIICFDHWGGQYIENGTWHTDVNILWSTVTYLNATINVNPEKRNRRLEMTGVAKPGKTRRLTGTGLGLARQQSAGKVFRWVWNRTNSSLQSKYGPQVDTRIQYYQEHQRTNQP